MKKILAVLTAFFLSGIPIASCAATYSSSAVASVVSGDVVDSQANDQAATNPGGRSYISLTQTTPFSVTPLPGQVETCVVGVSDSLRFTHLPITATGYASVWSLHLKVRLELCK